NQGGRRRARLPDVGADGQLLLGQRLPQALRLPARGPPHARAYPPAQLVLVRGGRAPQRILNRPRPPRSVTPRRFPMQMLRIAVAVVVALVVLGRPMWHAARPYLEQPVALRVVCG